jgi:glucosamine 6-phosphate synthetase-like amidotransferase/phosphosugar isomerase protein
VLLAAAIAAGRARGTLSSADEDRLAHALIEVPAQINEVLNKAATYRRVAEDILSPARDVLYLGRGLSFPIALEGALKLKEISYIHAEGYAGGEMKHGPIALIDETVPVVVVAPSDPLFDKITSNFEQVKARGGRVILLSDAAGTARLGGDAAAILTLPTVDPVVSPIVYTIAVQLLAYYTAVAKGTDVDQPQPRQERHGRVAVTAHEEAGRPQAPLRYLHAQVDRGRARHGIQQLRCAARGVQRVHCEPAGRRVGSSWPTSTTMAASRAARSNDRR